MQDHDDDLAAEAEACAGPDDADPAEWRDATPLCTRCLTPFDPLQHYCHVCGAAVGQLTPHIPFVNIAWTYSFFDILWRTLWLDRRMSTRKRILYGFGIALNIIIVPVWIMLLALPFWVRERRKHPPPGFCACGYDLRGGHPGARCPECGAVMPTTAEPRP